MTCAANLVDAATEDAQPRSDALDTVEQSNLEVTYGANTVGVRSSGYPVARKELERSQKQRSKRFVRDALDRSLLDLASFYRDVVAVQLGSPGPLVNQELAAEVATMARGTTGEVTAQRLEAIFATRKALEGEVAPLLALESLMISLRGGLHD